MNNSRLKLIFGTEIAICILLVIYSFYNSIGFMDVISFPFVQIAYILRALSLNGGVVNMLAIALYVLICLVPVIMLLLKFRKETFKTEDSLLVLLSFMLFVAIYYLINPGLMPGTFALRGLTNSGIFNLCSMLYITIISYLVLWLIRKFDNTDTDVLLKYLGVLVFIIIGLYLLNLFAFTPINIIADIRSLREVNTMSGINFTLTDIFIVFNNIVKIIPDIYLVLILIVGTNLIDILKTDKFSDEASTIIKQIEGYCRKGLLYSTIATFAVNLIQILLSRSLLSTDINVDIPLFSLILLLLIMLVSRYFAESRRMKEEMDLFI